MGWDSSLRATKCTANQIQQGISRALNFKTTAEVQPWNALPVSIQSPAQSQEQQLSRSRRVVGIAPGHREALPILITTPQLGAKAGQVKEHAGLLPWHCNPPLLAAEPGTRPTTSPSKGSNDESLQPLEGCVLTTAGKNILVRETVWQESS